MPVRENSDERRWGLTSLFFPRKTRSSSVSAELRVRYLIPLLRLLGCEFMKVPGFNSCIRTICVGCLVLANSAVAASPEAGSHKSAGSRTRPQVIYHLPSTSNYAATLHSQAKGQNHKMPVENSMPAPVAQQPQAVILPPQERPTKTKVHSSRSANRQRSFINSSARGNGRGHKSHKN